MPTFFEEEAAVTAQNQITIPAAIRKVLKITGGKSRVVFRLRETAKGVVVVVEGAPKDEPEDPALAPFLDLIAGDFQQHPERIRPVAADLVRRSKSLVDGVKVDLDQALTGED